MLDAKWVRREPERLTSSPAQGGFRLPGGLYRGGDHQGGPLDRLCCRRPVDLTRVSESCCRFFCCLGIHYLLCYIGTKSYRTRAKQLPADVEMMLLLMRGADPMRVST